MEASLNGPLGQIILTTTVLTIGRAPDNQLVVQDQQASAHHAEIRPDAQGYLLVDLNSSNGTFVNEQLQSPQMPRLLTSGDVIRIGETRLSFEIAGSYDATVRASVGDFASPGYAPTMSAPPPDYGSYQQPMPSAPNYPPAEQAAYPPPPAYPAYQQPAPYAQNYAGQSYPPQPGYPPPGYPQQPWAGAPAGVQQKKPNTAVIIGIVVLLLLVVGGVGVYLVTRSTPGKTLDTFCSDLQSGDYHGAYTQFSNKIQEETSEQTFIAIFNAAHKVTSCTHSNPVISGSTATATLEISYAAAISESDNVVLVQDSASNNVWKIDSIQSTS